MSVVINQGDPASVTPCPYCAGMDTNGAGSGQVAGPEAFWSWVSGILGGLDWASMSAGVRQAWLSTLSNVEGAVAASRAEAIAQDAGQKGAAERIAELVRATGMSGRDAAAEVKAADTLAAAPAVAEALATGAITRGHVDTLMRDLPAWPLWPIRRCWMQPGATASTVSKRACVTGRPTTMATSTESA